VLDIDGWFEKFGISLSSSDLSQMQSCVKLHTMITQNSTRKLCNIKS